MSVRISGEVVEGRKLGRKIGFPTANIKLDKDTDIAPGVYAVRVECCGRQMCAIANIGFRPTVEHNGELMLEVNIFDFNGDLYAQRVEVEIVEYLRKEQQFESVEQLRKQIEVDVARAHDIFDNK